MICVYKKYEQSNIYQHHYPGCQRIVLLVLSLALLEDIGRYSDSFALNVPCVYKRHVFAYHLILAWHNELKPGAAS